MSGGRNIEATKTTKACVIGWPVAHSLSPLIHNHWMRQHGIDGIYQAVAVDVGGLGDYLRGLERAGLVGANITIPHKQAAIALVDALDPVAEKVGAVNTVIVRPGGQLFGLNTDGAGFLNWLAEAAPEWRIGQAPALVLGAGGAARAIVAALLDGGIPELILTNRSAGRAEILAENITSKRLSVIPWEERSAATTGAGLLVNCTSLGMTEMPGLEIDLSGMDKGAIVYDIVYAPLKTPLLAAGSVLGLKTVDGLGMLCHQAALAFEAWFGVLPAVDRELREMLEQAINKAGERGRGR